MPYSDVPRNHLILSFTNERLPRRDKIDDSSDWENMSQFWCEKTETRAITTRASVLGCGDTASENMALQREVEKLRAASENDAKERAGLVFKVEALKAELQQARYEIEALKEALAERKRPRGRPVLARNDKTSLTSAKQLFKTMLTDPKPTVAHKNNQEKWRARVLMRRNSPTV